MKVSLNWAQELSNVKLMPHGIDDLAQKIGAQLGAVEEITETGSKYDGVAVAKVISCEKHPNADKLQVCFIDDGGTVQDVERNADGHVQVVCGAPNVCAGLTVAWLPPGATVPSTYGKEPLVLEPRELRGVVSNGMLASPSELDISDNHDGILEIDVQEVGEDMAKPGTPFKQLYGLDDIIIDIENKMFTHRPDCFGVLGVAREIAGIQQQAFKSPDWYLNRREDIFENASMDSTHPVNVLNELPELVPRFIVSSIKNIEIKQSPIWLQAGLHRVGINSINNIVDITNYISYITGQPMHAYDYDKVQQLNGGTNPAQLVIRYPKPGEKVALLNGKEIEPRPEAIMIATQNELIGIGGVMGGSTTEVDTNTKNIILECANFNMYSIRRTSMAHGLFTDAVTRFTKGQSPLQNDIVMAQAIALVKEMAGGSLAGLVDDNHVETLFAKDNSAYGSINVETDFINARLGLKLTKEEIISLLTNVEFDAHDAGGPICVASPIWRTDIAIPEDIVEEVGRLYGYEKLPLVLPKRTMMPTKPDMKLEVKQKLRKTLASFGANEILTYSFVHGNLIEKAGQNKDLAFKLANALSPDLQYYRMSLTPSLLNQVHSNIKSGHDAFTLFEINKTHIKLHKNDDNGVPKELEMIGLVTAAKSSKGGSAYYQARAYLDKLAASLGIRLRYDPVPADLDYAVTAPFDPKRSALVSIEGSNNGLLGIVGEYKPLVAKALKLPEFCAGFEIGLEAIMTIKPQNAYTPLSRYPSISQDICLEIDESLPYGTLTDALDAALQASTKLDLVIDFEPIDIYKADNSDKKHITYRVTVTSYERTLTEDAVTAILTQVASVLHESHGAIRI